MSRWVYLLGVGIALVAMALAFTDWALSMQPGVTEANARRIHPGMTVEEANAILGERGTVIFRCLKNQPEGPLAQCIWSSKAVEVCAYMVGDGRIYEVIWQPVAGARPPLFARLRAWLGW